MPSQHTLSLCSRVWVQQSTNLLTCETLTSKFESYILKWNWPILLVWKTCIFFSSRSYFKLLLRFQKWRLFYLDVIVFWKVELRKKKMNVAEVKLKSPISKSEWSVNVPLGYANVLPAHCFLYFKHFQSKNSWVIESNNIFKGLQHRRAYMAYEPNQAYCLFLQFKFYWNTAMFIDLHILQGRFCYSSRALHL